MFSVKICLGLCRAPDHLFDGLCEGVLFLSRMLLGKLELLLIEGRKGARSCKSKRTLQIQHFQPRVKIFNL